MRAKILISLAAIAVMAVPLFLGGVLRILVDAAPEHSTAILGVAGTLTLATTALLVRGFVLKVRREH